MKPRIKIAQIGVTHEHAVGKIIALKRLSDVFELVGVVDDRETSLTNRYFNDDLAQYEGIPRLTPEEVFNYPGLQAVTVEVPNNELVPMAIRCMEHGLAMHMDKPAGEDLDLYRQLLDGCRKQHLPFQMGYMFRGNPAFQFCLKAIREKVIGDVFEIEADMNHNYGGDEYQKYIGNFRGGIMYNLGCHLIDFVVAALGRPDRVVPFLKSAPDDPDRILNNSMAVLEYPHATAVVRSCSRNSGIHNRRMHIAGTKGTICFSPLERFDGQPVELTLDLSSDSSSFPAGRHVLRFPPQADRYENQLLELAAIIRDEIASPYSYDHDYLVHEVTLAAANCCQWR